MNLLQNKYFRLSVLAFVCACLGAGVGYFAKPTKIITKIEEKEVIKYIENKKENKDVVVVTKKTTNKDGSIVEESRTEDKTKIETDKTFTSNKETKHESITINDIGLSVHALTMANIEDINNRQYGVFIKKRIFSNISIGGLVTDKKTLGLSIGLDF